jgi:small subunit ribosomal protein S1
MTNDPITNETPERQPGQDVPQQENKETIPGDPASESAANVPAEQHENAHPEHETGDAPVIGESGNEPPETSAASSTEESAPDTAIDTPSDKTSVMENASADKTEDVATEPESLAPETAAAETQASETPAAGTTDTEAQTEDASTGEVSAETAPTGATAETDATAEETAEAATVGTDTPAGEASKSETPASDEEEIQSSVSDTPASETPSSDASPAETPAGETPSSDESPAESPAAAAASEPAPEAKPDPTDESMTPIWEELVIAYEQGKVLSATLVKPIRGGALADIQGFEGFIPKSHFNASGHAGLKDIEALVGQTIDLVIMEISDFEKRRFTCSRKNAFRKMRLKEFKQGQTVEGVVTTITPYGAFVDLGGIDGLIHISRMSKVRVNHPSEIVKVGQTVKVKIVEVNHKDDRIALSTKEFTATPWQTIEDKYSIGDIVKGKVQNITSFGVYVQLEPGLTGMIHISDLSWTARVAHPSELLNNGDTVEVKITGIRPKDRRLSLSLREAQPDPWPRLATLYPRDSEVTGIVKDLLDAGMLVRVEDNLDCFVPKGRMGSKRGGRRGGQAPAAPAYAVGDTVNLKILEMDPQKHTFVGAVLREEREERGFRRDRDSGGDFEIPRATASDKAFRLGDIEGLQKLLASSALPDPDSATDSTEQQSEQPTEAVVKEAAPEQPTDVVVEDAAPEQPADVVEETAPDQPADAVVEETTPEQPTDVVVEEAAPEQPADVVVEEAAPEQPTDIVVEEAAPEQPTDIVVEDAAPEQPTDVVVEEVASEQPTEAVVEESAPEQPTDVVVEDAAPEQPTDAVVEEAAPEQPTDVDVEETASEQPTEAVVEESVPEQPTDVVVEEAAPEQPAEADDVEEKKDEEKKDEDISPAS